MTGDEARTDVRRVASADGIDTGATLGQRSSSGRRTGSSAQRSNETQPSEEFFSFLSPAGLGSSELRGADGAVRMRNPMSLRPSFEGIPPHDPSSTVLFSPTPAVVSPSSVPSAGCQMFTGGVNEWGGNVAEWRHALSPSLSSGSSPFASTHNVASCASPRWSLAGSSTSHRMISTSSHLLSERRHESFYQRGSQVFHAVHQARHAICGHSPVLHSHSPSTRWGSHHCVHSHVGSYHCGAGREPMGHGGQGGSCPIHGFSYPRGAERAELMNDRVGVDFPRCSSPGRGDERVDARAEQRRRGRRYARDEHWRRRRGSSVDDERSHRGRSRSHESHHRHSHHEREERRSGDSEKRHGVSFPEGDSVRSHQRPSSPNRAGSGTEGRTTRVRHHGGVDAVPAVITQEVERGRAAERTRSRTGSRSTSSSTWWRREEGEEGTGTVSSESSPFISSQSHHKNQTASQGRVGCGGSRREQESSLARRERREDGGGGSRSTLSRSLGNRRDEEGRTEIGESRSTLMSPQVTAQEESRMIVVDDDSPDERRKSEEKKQKKHSKRKKGQKKQRHSRREIQENGELFFLMYLLHFYR